MDSGEDKQRRNTGWNKLWPALTGGLGGAVIVGAVLGLVAHGQNNPLMASVGTKQFHQSDFRAQMESLAGQQTMQQMIDNQLIKDGAKAHHVTASSQDLSQALQNLEARYGVRSNSQLQQFLKSNGLTRSQLNDILTVNILQQKLSEQSVTVTNKEIQDYYNQHKTAFTLPGTKTPQPLSKVRSQIVAQIKQSKAVPRVTLLMNLAKNDKVNIYDAKYASIQQQLEPATTQNSTTNATTT